MGALALRHATTVNTVVCAESITRMSTPTVMEGKSGNTYEIIREGAVLLVRAERTFQLTSLTLKVGDVIRYGGKWKVWRHTPWKTEHYNFTDEEGNVTQGIFHPGERGKADMSFLRLLPDEEE